MNTPTSRTAGVETTPPLPESLECDRCAGLGLAFRGRDERTGERNVLLCAWCRGTGIRILRGIPARGGPPYYGAPRV